MGYIRPEDIPSSEIPNKHLYHPDDATPRLNEAVRRAAAMPGFAHVHTDESWQISVIKDDGSKTGVAGTPLRRWFNQYPVYVGIHIPRGRFKWSSSKKSLSLFEYPVEDTPGGYDAYSMLAIGDAKDTSPPQGIPPGELLNLMQVFEFVYVTDTTFTLADRSEDEIKLLMEGSVSSAIGIFRCDHYFVQRNTIREFPGFCGSITVHTGSGVGDVVNNDIEISPLTYVINGAPRKQLKGQGIWLDGAQGGFIVGNRVKGGNACIVAARNNDNARPSRNLRIVGNDVGGRFGGTQIGVNGWLTGTGIAANAEDTYVGGNFIHETGLGVMLEPFSQRVTVAGNTIEQEATLDRAWGIAAIEVRDNGGTSHGNTVEENAIQNWYGGVTVKNAPVDLTCQRNTIHARYPATISAAVRAQEGFSERFADNTINGAIYPAGMP